MDHRSHDRGPRTGVAEADLLLEAARTLRRRWGAGLADLDLSPHESRALRVVVHGARRHAPDGTGDPEATITSGSDCDRVGAAAPRLADIAAALRIAPRSATEVVDRLVARGLVARRPSHTDRRAVEVIPTAAGIAAFAGIEEVWRAASEEFLAPLGPADRETLADLLRTLLPHG